MAENQTDEQLLRAFVAGKRPALAELARRYERPLLGLCSGVLASQGDRVACDVVQETWLRVIRFGGSFDGRSRFKTWLYRIAINQCRSLLAARPAEEPSEQLDSESSAEVSPARAVQEDELKQQVIAVAWVPHVPRTWAVDRSLLSSESRAYNLQHAA